MPTPPHNIQQVNDAKSTMGSKSMFAPYLENIAFPKSREAILQVIEENTENRTEDNESIMERFRQIPDAVYNSVEDVRKALGDEYENYGVVKKTEEKNVQASQTDRR